MKLITELIEFALQHGMLTEEHKQKLQDDGFYTFYADDEEYCSPNDSDYEDDSVDESSESFGDSNEDELDRNFYGDYYHHGKRSGGHRGKRKSPPVGQELTVEELNHRIQVFWKKLTVDFPRLAQLLESWKAGKLMRVLADGFTFNDVYALMKVDLPDFHDFSGPVSTAYRQLLRQVGNTVGKYSWVIKNAEMASMVEFPKFRQQILENVRTLYETDRDRFAALSSQNGRLNFPFWEKAVQTDTTSMKVWTILNLTSQPVTVEQIEAIQTWKPELAIAMQINLDYITELLAKLVQRDWSSLTVITECKIVDAILKSVIIPDGALKIEDGAFYNCSSLTSVAIPEGVISIGDRAFSGCSSLTSVSIPDGLIEIGADAFDRCSSLTPMSIPESVKVIAGGAFYGCSPVTSVSIPDGVKYGFCAFKHCSAPGKALLTADGKYLLDINDDNSEEFVIPESVKVIVSGALYDCRSLKFVSIPEGVKTIEPKTFSYCVSLKSVILPEGLTEIGSEAFNSCRALTSVTIPDGVKEIEKETFWDCCSLTSVELPEGLTTIGDGAFEFCSSLTSVAIPESVKKIGVKAFHGCRSLTSVAIPEGVTEIENETFQCCSSLTSLAIPKGTLTIRTHAFFRCSSLTSVKIPRSVRWIGSETFMECPNLTIHAPAGSYAEKYANEKNIPFQPLEDEK